MSPGRTHLDLESGTTKVSGVGFLGWDRCQAFVQGGRPSRRENVGRRLWKTLAMDEDVRKAFHFCLREREMGFEIVGKGKNHNGNLHEGGRGFGEEWGGQCQSQKPPQGRLTKMDFLKFKGGDSLQWIQKVELFIDYLKVPKEQWVKIDIIHKEGDVFKCAARFRQAGRRVTWKEFDRDFCSRFGHLLYENFGTTLHKLVQKNIITEFKKLMTEYDGKTMSSWRALYQDLRGR